MPLPVSVRSPSCSPLEEKLVRKWQKFCIGTILALCMALPSSAQRLAVRRRCSLPLCPVPACPHRCPARPGAGLCSPSPAGAQSRGLACAAPNPKLCSALRGLHCTETLVGLAAGLPDGNRNEGIAPRSSNPSAKQRHPASCS